MSRATLSTFIADQMRRQQLNNNTLAEAAGISEGAVRNLLKHGSIPNAKDPDARTLRRVAEALNINPMLLYRLAGYLPSEPNVKSIRAEFVADVFDRLSVEKQEAVLGVLDVMANDVRVSRIVQAIKSDAGNPLAGFDLHAIQSIRIMANALIAAYQMTEPVDIRKIDSETQVLHYKWGNLPQSTQERIIGLIRYKLTLDYDPTMVETEWRD